MHCGFKYKQVHTVVAMQRFLLEQAQAKDLQSSRTRVALKDPYPS